MIVAYIALGIASGLLAAVLTFVAGHGFLMAFAAYVLVGSTITIACILMLILPARTATPVKRTVTQRS